MRGCRLAFHSDGHASLFVAGYHQFDTALAVLFRFSSFVHNHARGSGFGRNSARQAARFGAFVQPFLSLVHGSSLAILPNMLLRTQQSRETGIRRAFFGNVSVHLWVQKWGIAEV